MKKTLVIVAVIVCVAVAGLFVPTKDKPKPVSREEQAQQRFAQMNTFEKGWTLLLAIKTPGSEEAGKYNAYINGLSRDEAALACRQSYAFYMAERGKPYFKDMPCAVFAGKATAMFIEAYMRTFGEGEEVDPAPFRQMIQDESVIPEFREALAGLLARHGLITD